MALTAELHIDTPMLESFAMQAIRKTQLVQQGNGAVLEDASPDAGFHVLPGPGFQDHALDPRPLQQVGQDETRRPGPDDPDLRVSRRVHRPPSPRIPRSWAARARSIQIALAPR